MAAGDPIKDYKKTNRKIDKEEEKNVASLALMCIYQRVDNAIIPGLG